MSSLLESLPPEIFDVVLDYCVSSEADSHSHSHLVSHPESDEDLDLDHDHDHNHTSKDTPFSLKSIKGVSLVSWSLRHRCLSRLLRHISWNPNNAPIVIPEECWDMVRSISLDIGGGDFTLVTPTILLLPSLPSLHTFTLSSASSGPWSTLMQALSTCHSLQTLSIHDSPSPLPCPSHLTLPSTLTSLTYTGFGKKDILRPGVHLSDVFLLDGEGMATNMMLSILSKCSINLRKLAIEGSFMCFEYLAALPWGNLKELRIRNRPLTLQQRSSARGSGSTTRMLYPIQILRMLTSLKVFELCYPAIHNNPYILSAHSRDPIEGTLITLPSLQHVTLNNLFPKDRILSSLSSSLTSLSILSSPRCTLWGPIILPPSADRLMHMLRKSGVGERLKVLRVAVAGSVNRSFLGLLAGWCPVLEELEIQRCAQGMGGLERYSLEAETPDDISTPLSPLPLLHTLLLDIGHIDDKTYFLHPLSHHLRVAEEWAVGVSRRLRALERFGVPVLSGIGPLAGSVKRSQCFWVRFGIVRVSSKVERDGRGRDDEEEVVVKAVMEEGCEEKYRFPPGSIQVFQNASGTAMPPSHVHVDVHTYLKESSSLSSQLAAASL